MRYLTTSDRLILHRGEHDDCSRSKMCRRGKKRGSGYPIGLLCAWGESAYLGDRDAHQAVKSGTFSREGRRSSREEFRKREGSAWFFTREDAKLHPDDDTEPEVVL